MGFKINYLFSDFIISEIKEVENMIMLQILIEKKRKKMIALANQYGLSVKKQFKLVTNLTN